MLKKLLIISSTLLFLVVITLGVYNLAFKPDSSASGNNQTNDNTNNGNSNNNNEGENNPPPSDKIIEFSSEPALGATVAYDKTGVKYYHRDTGNVYQALLDGSSRKVVSTAVLKDLIDVKWSPAKDQVITMYKDASFPHQKKFVFFDYSTKKATVLNKNISDLVWLPSGSQIAYHYFDADSNTGSISTSLPDGTEWKKVMDLNIRDVVLNEVPEQAKISFHLKPTSYRESSLQTISTLGGDPVTVLNDKFGLGVKWSPDGTKALVAITKERASNKITLGVVDVSENYEFKELNIETTIDKAVWAADSESIYYALPEAIPDESVMPDDYISKNIRTADTFWRVNMRDRKKDQLTFKDDSKIIYDATNLFLSPKIDKVFFTNRDDGKVYYVKI